MNLNQLEWFCSAYDEHSIAKAAEKSFVSRQALGRSIRTLESELGVKLFIRNEMGVTPTALAHRVYPLARQALRAAERIRRQCDETLLSERAQVKIAFAHSMLDSLPEDFFDRLLDACPYVDILTEKHFLDDCLELLKRGEVDFAVCPGPIQDELFEEVVLTRYDLSIAVPRSVVGEGHPIDLRVLSTLPFFVLSDSLPGRTELEMILDREGLMMRIDYRHRDLEAVIREVRRGTGACIVAGSEAPSESREIALAPFPDPNVKMTISLVYLPDKAIHDESGILRFVNSWIHRAHG